MSVLLCWSLDDRTLFVLKLEHGRNYCTDKRIIHLYLKAFSGNRAQHISGNLFLGKIIFVNF